MRGALRPAVAIGVLGLLALPGCSVRKMAINSLGNALSGSTSGWASDDDPELVGDAIPFALKTIESLLAEAPEHRGLLLAAASGFTQYGFAYVEQEADFLEEENYTRATELRGRARRLYLRARGYGMRGLEVAHPGFETGLRADAGKALARLRKPDVPFLYWTAAAWGAAISLAVDEPELTADQHLVEAMMRRALELDETFSGGALHDFFMVWEGGRTSIGGSLVKAREHYERALELAAGSRAWPHVSYAETVAVGQQERAQFVGLLKEALAVDADRFPDQRLANLIAQKRARWLLAHADELFVD